MQFLNAPSSMVVTFEGSEMAVNLAHPLKADSPIVVTLAGKETEVMPPTAVMTRVCALFSKTPPTAEKVALLLLTESVVKLEHPSNAPASMVVSESGSMIDLILVRFAKAPSLMVVTG